MWFEADPILPNFPTIDLSPSDFGFDRGRLPNAWSELAASRAAFDRNDPLSDLDWAAGVAPLRVDLFSPTSAIADEWGKAIASKDSYRAMNEDGPIVVIKEYDASDRGTDTSDSGETVAPDTEAPPC